MSHSELLSELLKDKSVHPVFEPAQVRDKFLHLYGEEPLLVRSPGRINLIGEHTDYNEGFVMPAAIDRDIVFAVGPSSETYSTLYSLKHGTSIRFDPAKPEKVDSPQWANYLLGVARRFTDKGYSLKPIHCVVGGDVPTGAGLSSSAALECGFAFALNHLHAFQIPKLELVHMAQWAEHHYVGVMCGIMDQFSSMMGVDGKAFVLDCRSLSYQYFNIDLADHAIVLCDTLVKHSLSDSAYNTRRQECEHGVRILQNHNPQIKSLRDATPEIIETYKNEFPDKVYQRCRYVVEENQRVLAASLDLKNGDLLAFGQKMYASHEGLSHMYEVSCEELDFLVDHAKQFEGVLGARMMGGGFGGCTINIVEKAKVESFLEAMRTVYRQKFLHDMNSYVVAVKDGTGIITPPVA